jgi:hypothetical protein
MSFIDEQDKSYFQPIIEFVIQYFILHHQLSITTLWLKYCDKYAKNQNCSIFKIEWHPVALQLLFPVITLNGNGKVIRVSGNNIRLIFNKIYLKPSMLVIKR